MSVLLNQGIAFYRTFDKLPAYIEQWSVRYGSYEKLHDTILASPNASVLVIIGNHSTKEYTFEFRSDTRPEDAKGFLVKDSFGNVMVEILQMPNTTLYFRPVYQGRTKTTWYSCSRKSGINYYYVNEP